MPQKSKDILIIYCNCTYYDFIPENTRKSVLKALTDAGVRFEAVSDLCLLAARKDPILQKWAKTNQIRIIACFPRAVRWLFKAGNAQLPPDSVEFFNMRNDPPENIIAGLGCSQRCEKEDIKPAFSKDSDWVPWFPVIDYDRCRNCKQCMNFCLFGVYGLSEEGKVEVQKPSSCKTNCPACARVCPFTAIIFPKYSDSPINGDEIKEQVNVENKTAALSEALQGNVYDAIRRRSRESSGQSEPERNRKRFSVNSENKMSAGNPYSLDKMQKELKIPNEVLSSLSPAEILKIRAQSQKNNPEKADNIKREHP